MIGPAKAYTLLSIRSGIGRVISRNVISLRAPMRRFLALVTLREDVLDRYFENESLNKILFKILHEVAFRL